MLRIAVVIGVVLMAAVACGRQPAAEPPPDDVLIFAAASLQTALEDMKPQLASVAGGPVDVSYAASSALARQIEAGAPADLFISADLEWMDYLQERNAIRRESRVNLLGNSLVLVAPVGDVPALSIAPGFRLAEALGVGRLAIADPAVPAGRYGRAALTSLGVWDSVADRLAPAENVRAALLLVSRREAPLGVVYRTDAAADPAVAIVDTFPPTSHPPIVYPAALLPAADARANVIFDFLRSEPASAVFARHGFDVLTTPR